MLPLGRSGSTHRILISKQTDLVDRLVQRTCCDPIDRDEVLRLLLIVYVLLAVASLPDVEDRLAFSLVQYEEILCARWYARHTTDADIAVVRHEDPKAITG